MLEISPQLDEKNNVTPHDHEVITDASNAIRRVSEMHVITNKEGNKVVSSLLMKTNHELSVDLEILLLSDDINPIEHVTAPDWMGALIFNVGVLRAEELMVGYDPLDDNIYHGEVWGKITRGKAKRLLGDAEWLVEIPATLIT